MRPRRRKGEMHSVVTEMVSIGAAPAAGLRGAPGGGAGLGNGPNVFDRPRRAFSDRAGKGRSGSECAGRAFLLIPLAKWLPSSRSNVFAG